jgi:hypothetical protein
MSKPSRKSPPPQPPAAPNRGKAPLIIGIVTIAALAVGAFVVIQNNNQPSASTAVAPAQPAAAVPAAPAQPSAVQATATPPPAAPAQALKPHTQKQYPPLALPGYALGRSQDAIRAAYQFAADHPEILTYVPCFCGCERSGHKGNEDCFVKTRGANGDVTEWEPHGMECNVCLDVATQAMQMHASGASVRDIRAAVEQKWAAQAAQSHTHTPTPEPPKN